MYKDGGGVARRKEIGEGETRSSWPALVDGEERKRERETEEGSRAGVTVKGKIGREVEEVERDESLSPPLPSPSLLLLLLLLLCTRAVFDPGRRS